MTGWKKKRQPSRQKRGAYTPPMVRVPSRSADEPFCAYFGPHGETCAEKTGLEVVLAVPGGPPRLAWMACPHHREQVRELVQAFVARVQAAPQTVAFTYQGATYETQVRATDTFQA